MEQGPKMEGGGLTNSVSVRARDYVTMMKAAATADSSVNAVKLYPEE